MSRAEHLKVVKNLLSNSVTNLREAAVAAGRAGDLEFGHDVTQIVFCADALLTRWNRGPSRRHLAVRPQSRVRGTGTKKRDALDLDIPEMPYVRRRD